MALPKIGNLAPVFTLMNQTEVPVALKDFRGKSNVVVYFYPRAATPGCTVQACGIRDAQAEFAALDAVVLGISPDPVAKLVKFTDKQALNFPLLSDEDLSTAKKYGVWGLKKFMGREFMGILRTSFLIDKEGRLRFIMDKVKTKSHDQEILSYIKIHL